MTRLTSLDGTAARSSFVAITAALLFATIAPAQEARTLPPFVEAGDVDPSVPHPDDYIGHAVGADAVRYDALVRYLHALAEASDLVTLTPHGETHEGRTLYHLTITSRRNHEHLDEILAGSARLADPRGLSDDEAEEIIESLPGIAWLAYSIHGDEVSPCDSAMMIAYVLAAGRDEATTRLRDELVINIDPLQNPDGRERYLAQIQTLRGKVPNTDVQAMHHAGLWSAGRGNHYLFDMNRDWLGQAHPETRGRTAAILRWHPHLIVDAHEMGSLDTYLFDPPREPLNPNITPSNLKWRRAMSADQAAAFDRYGWSYYTGEWYEEWYPGYTNAWGALIGAVSLLYEQAGVNGAAVKQEAGNVLAYAEAVDHNVVSSFANLETLRTNRESILRDYLADRRAAVGEQAETFLLPPAADGSRRERLLDILRRDAIEYTVAGAALEAEGVRDIWGERAERMTLPAGTVVIPAQQPHRELVRALLSFDPRMTDEFLLKERDDLENDRGSRLYDVTAWSLPMAFGLEAYTADRVRAVTPAEAPDDAPPAEIVPSAFGYLVPFDDGDVYGVLARLLAGGAKARVAREPFEHGGRPYRRGTVLLRGNENPEQLRALLAEATAGTSVEVVPVDTALSDKGPDLGGRRFVLLHEPRVALASQWPVSSTSFGSVWFMLDDRVGLRVSPVNIQRLGFMDLRTYNVLVIPSARGLDRVLGDGGSSRLRTWVQSGGTLIAMGGAASALAREDGLSGVRDRRDVLDELDVYDEDVQRELAARRIAIDHAVVWGDEAAPPRDGEDDASPSPRGGDKEALARADAWARRFSPQGSIVAARLDPTHWLAFGLGDRLPVLVSGRTALMAKPPVQTPVRLVEAESLRMSGLLWPEARERLAHTAWATVESVGNGQVILLANEPYYRAQWEGTGRLLLNAVFLGPGFGTDQPLPW